MERLVRVCCTHTHTRQKSQIKQELFQLSLFLMQVSHQAEESTPKDNLEKQLHPDELVTKEGAPRDSSSILFYPKKPWCSFCTDGPPPGRTLLPSSHLNLTCHQSVCCFSMSWWTQIYKIEWFWFMATYLKNEWHYNLHHLYFVFFCANTLICSP